MGFSEAVRHVLRDRYLAFSGRAGRAEFWWFLLFSVLAAAGATVAVAVAMIAVAAAGVSLGAQYSVRLVLQGLYVVGLLGLTVPLMAAAVRRLHDIGITGWTLLGVPVVTMAAAEGLMPGGAAIGALCGVLGACTRQGQPGNNRYGTDPWASAAAEVFR